MENRAVGFDYEPGSTFKPVTISGALENRLITPDSYSPCRDRSRSPKA